MMNGFSFHLLMTKQIPRYGKEVASERITVCVPLRIKDLWDDLSKNERVRLAQITREFLDQTLPKLVEQIQKENEL